MHWSTYERELDRAAAYSDANWAFPIVQIFSIA
jgi:hypothetical protein